MNMLEQNLGRKTMSASPGLWRRRSRLQRVTATLLPLLRRPGFSLALLVVVFSLVAAIAPHLLSSFDPYATSPVDKLRAPNLIHWFGTDELGRDLYTRVVFGSSLSAWAWAFCRALPVAALTQ